MRETKFDTIFDSQKIFRTLLDAFAHPGKVVKISGLRIGPPSGISKASAGVLFTLLDLEVGFAVSTCDKKQSEKIAEYFIINTGSRLKNLESADFILALGELPELERIKKGSLEYPDEGATIVYAVEEVNEPRPFYLRRDTTCQKGRGLSGIDSVRLTLTGPGINGERHLSLKGLKKQEVIKIMEVNKEFPLGIDFVFTDRKDKCFALPRSTRIVEVKEA
ncbi:MAG: Alpha-D-ribose 1-methylphosphonate 5-triphosphate synthase subunit PhnH [Dehalococcoidia bacterium]|nr:Alpha-D-ribose 1-methylphosphonate 5-triphosphate synthase subunit PhnH [Bacillota bacterium]MBT9139903.1 Alpha-D-ribose 1-methylphosphonate 5-triphosphate synthase subunit PhnH [Bacillota bacterium]